jgi:hypothetical protein
MSYIGQTLPADSFQGFTTDSFAGDGSATTFTLSKTPFNESALLVVINNVVQKPTTNFTVSGTTLTIVGTAVASGDVIYATHIGGALPIGQAASLDLNGASDQLILDADADTTISADTDDQIDFKAGGTDVMSMTATGLTINDGTTITTADNTDTLTLTSTDADGTTGPVLNLNRNSGSPANSDNIGFIRATGKNNASQDVDYTNIYNSIVSVADGAEYGAWELYVMNNGSLRSYIKANDSAVIINEDSQDINFTVESNANATCFKVDANAISGNGAVGIGAVNTARTFNITTPSSYSQYGMSITQASTSAPYGIYINYTGAAPDSGSDYYFFICEDTGGIRFQVASDGDVKNHDNSYGALSDERIKQDITDANSQWDDIKALKVRNFKMKDDIRQYGADKSSLRIGLIAQEVESVSPNLVDENKPNPSDVLSSSEFGTLYEDGDTLPEGKEIGDVKEVKENVKGIKYSVLYMKAIKALQEAMTKIETLETKVKALEDA